MSAAHPSVFAIEEIMSECDHVREGAVLAGSRIGCGTPFTVVLVRHLRDEWWLARYIVSGLDGDLEPLPTPDSDGDCYVRAPSDLLTLVSCPCDGATP